VGEQDVDWAVVGVRGVGRYGVCAGGFCADEGGEAWVETVGFEGVGEGPVAEFGLVGGCVQLGASVLFSWMIGLGERGKWVPLMMLRSSS